MHLAYLENALSNKPEISVACRLEFPRGDYNNPPLEIPGGKQAKISAFAKIFHSLTHKNDHTDL